MEELMYKHLLYHLLFILGCVLIITRTVIPQDFIDLYGTETTVAKYDYEGQTYYTTSGNAFIDIGRKDNTANWPNTTTNDIYRTIIRFELTGIPRDAYIFKAEFICGFTEFTCNSCEMSLYKTQYYPTAQQKWQNIGSIMKQDIPYSDNTSYSGIFLINNTIFCVGSTTSEAKIIIGRN
jgi:hypothetical protein